MVYNYLLSRALGQNIILIYLVVVVLVPTSRICVSTKGAYNLRDLGLEHEGFFPPLQHNECFHSRQFYYPKML